MSEVISNNNKNKTPKMTRKNKASLADILTAIVIGAILIGLIVLFVWAFIELDVIGIIILLLFFIFFGL